MNYETIWCQSNIVKFTNAMKNKHHDLPLSPNKHGSTAYNTKIIKFGTITNNNAENMITIHIFFDFTRHKCAPLNSNIHPRSILPDGNIKIVVIY